MMSPAPFKALSLALGAFFLNVPLGRRRARAARLSPRWLFFVHASVPVLALARLGLGLSWLYLPLSLAGAVAGQFAGGRLKAAPALTAPRPPAKLGG